VERPAGLHVLDHHSQPAAGGSPTVYLVHGSLDRAGSFGRVVRRLPELRVVTYDRRGYGRSRSMPLGVLADHVADLVELVGRGPGVVVGHSYGGDVALGAAIASPATVVGVGAYEPPLTWLDWWPRRARTAAEEDPARFAQGFFERMVGEGAWGRLTETARRERQADGPALLAELTSLRHSGPPFDLADLAVPAVFGRGGESAWRHRRAGEELHRAVPGSELLDIAGARHGAHLTHPAAFADLVRRVVDMAAASSSTP
jgi:pimeloyl-ACP methyl ester carboxylesterase